MGAPNKIVNHGQVEGWIREGKTYKWISDEHERLHGVRLSPAALSTFRERCGIPRRQVRDIDLMPWAVEERHRYLLPALMLRALARRRTGAELDEQAAKKLDSWLERLQSDDLVVTYVKGSDEGFFLVPRRKGVDTDVIRVPDKITGRKPRG